MQKRHCAWHCYHKKDEVFARFLSLLRENPDKKVFVHCRFGDDRTGMMVAAYRIAEQGWTAEAARKAMQAFGFTLPFFTISSAPGWEPTRLASLGDSKPVRHSVSCDCGEVENAVLLAFLCGPGSVDSRARPSETTANSVQMKEFAHDIGRKSGKPLIRNMDHLEHELPLSPRSVARSKKGIMEDIYDMLRQKEVHFGFWYLKVVLIGHVQVPRLPPAV